MSVSEYPALYSGQIRQLLQKDDIDLATITTKLIRKQLENDFNVHFSTKEEKKAINDLIRRIYDEVTEQSEEEESEEEGTGKNIFIYFLILNYNIMILYLKQ